MVCAQTGETTEKGILQERVLCFLLNDYVRAHIERSVSAMNRVLFALNTEYCLNKKKAVKMIDSFPARVTTKQRWTASSLRAVAVRALTGCFGSL